MPQADLGHQRLEAGPVGGGGAGVALVAVDDDDPLERPAERDRPVAQGVLADGALGVLQHLPQRALPDVEVGQPRQVARR